MDSRPKQGGYEPAASARPIGRRLAALAVVYALVWVNAVQPVLRLAPAGADEAIFALLMIGLPLTMLALAIRLARRWARVAVLVLLAPVLFLSLGLGLLAGFAAEGIMRDGRNTRLEPLASVSTQSGRVTVYRTNGGAMTDYGIKVRHARMLVPGIVLVVRDLYRHYHASEARLVRLGPGRVRVIVPEDPRGGAVLAVRRFVWP